RRERHRLAQPALGRNVDDVRLARGIGWIGIGVAHGPGDRHDRLLVPRVIVEDLIAPFDGAQVLLRDRIPHAAPLRLPLLDELIVAVVRGFLFEQPLHGALSPRVPFYRSVGHSQRSAVIGSTQAARHAGTKPASVTTPSIIRVAPAVVAGSVALTPNSLDSIR